MHESCDNCSRIISSNIFGNQDDRNWPFYFTLCINCINTCHKCGGDIGYPSHDSLSVQDCSLCGHHSCRSCRVNFECGCGCAQVACEECLTDKDKNKEVCQNLKRNFTQFECIRCTLWSKTENVWRSKICWKYKLQFFRLDYQESWK